MTGPVTRLPVRSPARYARFDKVFVRIPRLALLAALLGLALVPGEASADIFTFTDAEGVVHFTNRPKDPRYSLLFKSHEPKKAAPGVIPVPPSDTSVERFTRYAEWIRQAATL